MTSRWEKLDSFATVTSKFMRPASLRSERRINKSCRLTGRPAAPAQEKPCTSLMSESACSAAGEVKMGLRWIVPAPVQSANNSWPLKPFTGKISGTHRADETTSNLQPDSGWFSSPKIPAESEYPASEFI